MKVAPMPAADDAPDAVRLAHHGQLQHALKTHLTVILGRAHLLLRAVERSPGLTQMECVQLI
jgi:hypothetical protein